MRATSRIFLSFVGIVVLAALALFGLWYKGGSELSRLYPDIVPGKPDPMAPRLYYRGGIKLPGMGLVFLKRYHMITWKTVEGCTGEVRIRGAGYNPFREYYPDGSLRGEGECFVEPDAVGEQPLHDLHNVTWAKYYKADGSLGSEVSNGSGVQTWWTPQGVKVWELVLRDGARDRLSIWHVNGQLVTEHQYVDGKKHGLFVSFYGDGKKKVEGRHDRGSRAGRWVRYNEDGSVKDLEEYPTTGR